MVRPHASSTRSADCHAAQRAPRASGSGCCFAACLAPTRPASLYNLPRTPSNWKVSPLLSFLSDSNWGPFKRGKRERYNISADFEPLQTRKSTMLATSSGGAATPRPVAQTPGGAGAAATPATAPRGSDDGTGPLRIPFRALQRQALMSRFNESMGGSSVIGCAGREVLRHTRARQGFRQGVV